MSLNNVFQIAASALTAQSMRLNAVASNLANADSAHASTGEGYKAKQVMFQAVAINKAAPWAQGVRMTAGRPQGLRRLPQRGCGGGDGQHDLRLAFIPDQR